VNLLVRPRQDQAAARTAQRLVRRGRDHVGVRHRIRVDAGGDQAGDVRHVHHEVRADGIGDASEALPVDDAGIRREAGDDHARPMLLRELLDAHVVDLAGVRIEPVLHSLEQLAGEIHLRAVRQVPAVIEAHAEDRVAGIDQRQVRRGVRLRARMRLYVRVGRAEQFAGPLDRQAFGDVDVLAAAVVALAGIAFGVLVGQDRALRFQHPRTRIVLGRDQLDMVFLALPLGIERSLQLGIEPGNRHVGGEHGQPLGGEADCTERRGYPLPSTNASTTRVHARAMLRRL
jgi:hypothetical protein